MSEPILRVAGMADIYGFHYPAPAGSVYLELKATLMWTGIEPVTFRLGGPNPDCWLVTNQSNPAVYDSLGWPRTTRKPGEPDGPADSHAAVTLDKANPTADVTLLFMVPTRLGPTRLVFSHSQYIDLGAELKGPDPVVAGRSIAGRWEPVPEQDLPQTFKEDQAIMAALVKADKPQLIIEPQVDGFRLTIDKANISSAIKPRVNDPACFDMALKMGDQQTNVTMRMFNDGWRLLISFGPERRMQFAFQRSEAKMPGKDAPPGDKPQASNIAKPLAITGVNDKPVTSVADRPIYAPPGGVSLENPPCACVR